MYPLISGAQAANISGQAYGNARYIQIAIYVYFVLYDPKSYRIDVANFCVEKFRLFKIVTTIFVIVIGRLGSVISN